jgi:hypothetical protein
MIRRSHLNAEIACVQSASREIVLPCKRFLQDGQRLFGQAAGGVVFVCPLPVLLVVLLVVVHHRLGE